MQLTAFLALAALLLPASVFAYEEEVHTSVSASGGTSVKIESNSTVHDVQIGNIKVENGEVEVESTVDGKSIKTVTTTTGTSSKTTVTTDGVTQTFEGALPATFATTTMDGTRISIVGDSITIISGDGNSKSVSKVSLSSGLKTEENKSGKKVQVVHSSNIQSDTTLHALFSAGLISGDPGVVQNDDDLTLFAANVLHTNLGIADASFGEAEVTISLADKPKLFGFIPVMRKYVVVATNLQNDAAVTVTTPWWSMFTKKPRVADPDVSAKLATNLTAALTGNMNASAKQAYALATIINTLKAEGDTSLEVHAH